MILLLAGYAWSELDGTLRVGEMGEHASVTLVEATRHCAGCHTRMAVSPGAAGDPQLATAASWDARRAAAAVALSDGRFR